MDCENGDMKEEYVEEEDPLRITTSSGTGDQGLTKQTQFLNYL